MTFFGSSFSWPWPRPPVVPMGQMGEVQLHDQCPCYQSLESLWSLISLELESDSAYQVERTTPETPGL